MTFRELVENVDTLKPEVVRNRLRYALERFMQDYHWLTDHEIVEALARGDFMIIDEMEENDMFGTEGLDVTKGDPKG